MLGLKAKYQQGVGLLELMLSLAIIAIILIMTTRYYSSASNSQKITSAVDEINAVKGAMGSYLAGYPAGQTPSPAPTIGSLVQTGLLPPTFVASGTSSSSTTNPWGMSISIGTITAQSYQVLMTMPSADVCTTVMNQVNSSSGGGVNGPSSSCSGGALTATFYRN